MSPVRCASVPRRRDDGGYALVTVVGAMFVLTLVAAAALASAVGGLPQSKRAQSSVAAMAAAQAGVADLVTRLNLCRDYWLNPGSCAPVDLASPDTEGWRAVQGSDPGLKARYRVEFLVTPEKLPSGTSTVQSGLIRAAVVGEVTSDRRVHQRRVTVDLRQPGFLQYIYYTDFEAIDPLILSSRYPERRYDRFVLWSETTNRYEEYTDVYFKGIDATAAQACNRYWYGPGGVSDTRTTPQEAWTIANKPQSPRSRPCDLKFNGGDASTRDEVKGPLHTNDAMVVEDGAYFESASTTTSWRNPPGTTPPPDTTSTSVDWFRPYPFGSTAQPSASGKKPRYGVPVTMPWRSSDTRAAAARGCLYTGPTSVELLSTGRIRVHSPDSQNLSAECGGAGARTSPQEVAGPANGVIHVQNRARDTTLTTTCTTPVLPTSTFPGYPVTDASGRKDITKYPCTDGDVFVKGTAGRPMTVSAENDVVVVDDVHALGGATGNVVVGLVAQGHVEVYHPVACLDVVEAPKVCQDHRYTNLSTATDNVTIQAAIISMAHSFTVQNYDKGQPIGGTASSPATITVLGGIYQRFRGPVSSGHTVGTPGTTTYTTYKTGYEKKAYEYDRRLLDVPPPAFPVPVGATWAVTHFAEQAA